MTGWRELPLQTAMLPENMETLTPISTTHTDTHTRTHTHRHTHTYTHTHTHTHPHTHTHTHTDTHTTQYNRFTVCGIYLNYKVTANSINP